MEISKDDKLIQSIFKKCGYTIEYQDLDTDENGDEVEDSDEGWYWQDNDGNGSELFDFDSKNKCICDCLENLDDTDVNLSKAEQSYLSKFR